MDTNEEVPDSYPSGQLAAALVTAAAHEDAETRERAAHRVRLWQQVVDGLTSGTLAVGLTAPVPELPEWVTLEVVRGGFATGNPVAGGELQSYEIEVAKRVGIPSDRRALFAYYLTEAGLAELNSLLDSGGYVVEFPEQAAFLTVAWLIRTGDRVGALALLDTLAPFAAKLRFAPKPGTPVLGAEVISRETVADVQATLAAKRPNLRVAAMQEALTVWNPFSDELLAHWLETAEGDLVGASIPTGWQECSEALLDRYRQLAEQHTLCSKHRKPKENLAILLSVLGDVVAGRDLTPQRRGLLQHAVQSMLARRGRPGSAVHGDLRERQAINAAKPTHQLLAGIVLSRLAKLPLDQGIRSMSEVVKPLTAQESSEHEILAGAIIPPSIKEVTYRAFAASIEELVARGIISSSEMLATLTPKITAAVASAGYGDVSLQALMAANYRAFRKRRSLLLLNLRHQVQIEDLPWVQTVESHRQQTMGTKEQARAVLVRLGELALQGFPATIFPNPLIREFSALAKKAGLELPFVDELATDIFMGDFSEKYLHAAKISAELLRGTLYERYYGFSASEVIGIADVVKKKRLFARTSHDFAELCRRRADTSSVGNSVVANGMIIEQSQILTTHNLAVLAGPLGIMPAGGWSALARRSYHEMTRILFRVHHNPRPLTAIKDAAYAWRQTLFFLSMGTAQEQQDFAQWAGEKLLGQPPHLTARLGPVLAGLTHVLAGRTLADKENDRSGRRFLGWSSRHWMLH